MRSKRFVGSLAVAFSMLAVLCTAYAAGAFVTFESGQVRPLAMSPDGARLFVANTPDNTLEIFDIAPGALSHVGSVPVGLEPVAVAARSNAEVWVVNHLSDSVSVVDVTNPATAHVVRTLHVGDEPRDIVFAGAGDNRAFATRRSGGNSEHAKRHWSGLAGRPRVEALVPTPTNWCRL